MTTSALKTAEDIDLETTRGQEQEDSVRSALGFRDGSHGAHSARTIMVAELERLLSALPADTTRHEYERAIVEENLLGKPTRFSRKATATRLWELYGLDPAVPLFRVLRLYWKHEQEAHPLLALSCALARDPILRLAAPYVLDLHPGAVTTTDDLVEFLDREVHGRFNPTTLRAIAQRIGSSWTQSGHLDGRAKKVRSKARATPAAAAYAMFLGYAEGHRAARLFTTLWARVLDHTEEEVADLVSKASRNGLLSYRKIGTMIDVRFDHLLTPKEQELVR